MKPSYHSPTTLPSGVLPLNNTIVSRMTGGYALGLGVNGAWEGVVHRPPVGVNEVWEMGRDSGNNGRNATVGIGPFEGPGTSDARVHINLNELDLKEEDDDEIEDLTRPIGRDRAKTDRARARQDSSSQTTPDYNQGIEHLSQRIGDFNELKRERQRLVELQLKFTNIEHLTGVDREITEREKEKIRNKYRDN
ncbi:hypothetical protein R6Q57_015059 [Mikania cordata]